MRTETHWSEQTEELAADDWRAFATAEDGPATHALPTEDGPDPIVDTEYDEDGLTVTTEGGTTRRFGLNETVAVHVRRTTFAAIRRRMDR